MAPDGLAGRVLVQSPSQEPDASKRPFAARSIFVSALSRCRRSVSQNTKGPGDNGVAARQENVMPSITKRRP